MEDVAADDPVVQVRRKHYRERIAALEGANGARVAALESRCSQAEAAANETRAVNESLRERVQTLEVLVQQYRHAEEGLGRQLQRQQDEIELLQWELQHAGDDDAL